MNIPRQRCWKNIALGLILLGLSAPPLLALRQMELYIDYPRFEGDFYAEGIVSFPPAAVSGADNLAVYAADSNEVPSKVVVLSSWGDDSVLKAQVVFSANTSRRQQYFIGFGDGLRRQKGFEQTAVLPTVPFHAGGAPRAVENVELDVGTINVLVDRSPGVHYYWHVVPIVLLIGFTWWRTRRIRGRA